ncbi:MAG: PEGA domain-containing protein [Bacteroidota bacterium]
MKPRALCALLLLVAAGPSPARGGDSTLAQTPARLSVRADHPGADVFLNGERIGPAPLEISLPAGTSVVWVGSTASGSWFLRSASDTLHPEPGERMEKTYRLIHTRALLSEPAGLQVLLGDSVLGTTPLLVGGESGHGRFLLRGMGFPDTLLPGWEPGSYIHRVRLGGSAQAGWPPGETGLREDRVPRGPLLAAGGGALLAGAFSAWFKIRSDELHAQYLATGDPALAARVRRLDAAAGIALAVAQAGLGIAAYLLLSE